MSDPQKYTVGWICAVVTEFVAAQAFFDEEHDELETSANNDNNNYALGRIGKHNVVMAVLPKLEYGTTSAATVARDMLRSFPNVRIGLMVGIAGGAPTPKQDIRLGDIVISSRDGGKGGVFQYDFGKAIQEHTFQHTGTLNQPPQLLLTAVGSLEAKYKRKGHQLNTEVLKALELWPRLRKEYSRPPSDNDRLYCSDFVHQNSSDGCEKSCGNNPVHLVSRLERDEQEDDPAIHYGLIASSNQLMKDAITRDKLAADHGILCFEMEAAGLMNHFPCLVIRGICDYSDSHKNKKWQGFAAMTAAAYAKDLLRQIPPSRIEAEMPVAQVLNSMQENLECVQLAVAETNHTLTNIKFDTETSKMKDWLNPPDCSTNFNTAKKHRHYGTGKWLIDSLAFQEWKSGSRRHMWLYGLAGCGKTVLSTTILDDLRQTGGAAPVLAHFFDFNDPQKQTFDGLLRSLAFQVYSLRGEAMKELDSLFAFCNHGQRQPDEAALSACIESMIRVTGRVFVVLDALDECGMRHRLLDWMGCLRSGNAHFIVTARPEPDIRREIPRYFDEQNCISLDKKSIDADIHSYVLSTLEQNSSFSCKCLSQDLIYEICEKVGDGADGMFRWAACQLDSLARCLSSNAIRTALTSLPKDLNETYARMLKIIPSEYKTDAIRLLQFLVHTKAPLHTSQAIEIIATKNDRDSQHFHIGNRLFSEADVLHYCPSLVSIVEVKQLNGKTVNELHLAHFSVKEYLLTIQGFDLESSSILITTTLLTYLRDINGELEENKHDFPLAEHAAYYWMTFARLGENSDAAVQMAVEFIGNEATFRRWCYLCSEFSRSKLSLVCGSGLVKIATALIEQGFNVNEQDIYGNALRAACVGEHLNIVQLLLDKGADINAQGGGYYGNALQAASDQGNLNIIQLLLDKGADINAQGGDLGNALQATSNQGNLDIVQLLLDKGADINAQGGYYRNALQAASYRGKLNIVQLLLDKGANINAQGGYYGNALQAACYGEHLNIVQLLLDKGADINAQGGKYRNALQAASDQGNLDIVQLLLDKGADINAQGGYYGNALQAACDGEHLNIVQLLLDKGADINAQGGKYRNALQAASDQGNFDIVQLLLDKGADINAQGGYYGNALQAACDGEHLNIVQLLLDKGADINAQGGKYRNALQAASDQGNFDIVQLLLDKGADINAQGGYYGNALQVACDGEHLNIVQLLLDKGADINAQGGKYRNALMAASYRGKLDIVQLLLDKGADITVANNDGCTPIIIAAGHGHLALAKLLQNMPGCELNQTDDLGRSPVFWASRFGYVDVVQHLLFDARVDPRAQDWCGSTPLFAAVANGHAQIVELLISRYNSLANTGGFGRNLMWWARRAGNPRVVELLLQHGEQFIGFSDEDTSTDVATIPFDPQAPWCDACTLCVSEGSYCSCKECRYLAICEDCFHRGIRCWHPTHTYRFT